MSTYKNMEPIIQIINQSFISLDTHEVKQNNALLKDVIIIMTSSMKRLDPLIFADLYRNEFFGGSFYDSLKVGKPDEFDIDIKLEFPKCFKCATAWRSCQCIRLVESNKPGFLWLKVEPGSLSPAMEKKFLVDGYISTAEVRKWMESLVCRAYGEMKNTCGYTLRISKSGPAITLGILSEYGYWIDIDLVPSFIFNQDSWPASYRIYTKGQTEFFIVPKSPAQLGFLESESSRQRYWRPSFQEQERKLLSCKERLKPALRLLKKTRSNLNHHSISSYYLKTIVLWEADSYNGWNSNSLSDVFMKLLKDYRDALKAKNIKYYWKSNNNLLTDSSGVTIANHHNAIDRIIKKIDSEHKSDPCILARLLLTSEEFDKFRDIYRQSVGPNQSAWRSNGSSSLQDGSQAQTSTGWGAWAVLIGGAALVGTILGAVANRNNNRN